MQVIVTLGDVLGLAASGLLLIALLVGIVVCLIK